MPLDPEIERLARAKYRFLAPIRDRQGFDQTAFDELCAAIYACTERWHDKEDAPKILGWLLVNLAHDLTIDSGTESWYPVDEARRIERAGFMIGDLVSECFLPSQDIQDEFERQWDLKNDPFGYEE